MHRVQSHAHHYVPEWYQRRFLPPQTSKYYYLDLQPETIVQNGHSYQRRALRRLGPDSCFYKNDLYALDFGGQTTDEMEQFFFGVIDNFGCGAVAQLANFEGISDKVAESFRYFTAYMGAQRFRTPRGLAGIRRRSSAGITSLHWWSCVRCSKPMRPCGLEGVWEIVRARQKPDGSFW